MRIPPSGIMNVSHATVSALPLKLGVSGSLVDRIVKMVSVALDDASGEKSFPLEYWKAKPPSESMRRAAGNSQGVAPRPVASDSAEGRRVKALAGFVGESPYRRSVASPGRRTASSSVAPSVSARASVSRSLLFREQQRDLAVGLAPS